MLILRTKICLTKIYIKMKTLFKLFSLTVCVLFLSPTCTKEKPDNNQDIIVKREPTGGLTEYTYAVSYSNSSFRVSDSIYNFNRIEASYVSMRPFYNMNAFHLKLMDSVLLYYNSIKLEIFTKKISPEVFFKKGKWEVDTLYISNYTLGIPLVYGKGYYGNIRTVFTWERVFYENERFQGKGSFEIMDTLYTDYPAIYYPPQKIEFEFK